MFGVMCVYLGYVIFNNLVFSKKVVVIPLIALCFSITFGVLWEAIEYGFDKYLDGDMQKDVLVNSFDTSYFGTTNDIKKINNIKRTEIYTDSEIVVVYDGYLDIGLCDTMEDLIIDMIGSCFGGFVLFWYKKRNVTT